MDLVMNETIYTIPINEALDSDCDCPLCYLRGKLERDRVEYTLGASMMEPDSRAVTNSMGFCQPHFSMLLEQPNKLSFALVMETHLADLRRRIDMCSSAVVLSEKKPRFGKSNTSGADLLAGTLTIALHSCAICSHIDKTMERYIEVLFHMWSNDTAFRKRFDTVSHVCLPHYKLLAQGCAKHLKQAQANEFLQGLFTRQQAYLAELQADILHFTKKFDYRNADMPWGNAQDAPKRAAAVLAGDGKNEK